MKLYVIEVQGDNGYCYHPEATSNKARAEEQGAMWRKCVAREHGVCIIELEAQIVSSRTLIREETL